MIRGKKPEADLRRGYDRILWTSLACSALLNGLLILLYPTSEPEAYERSEPQIIMLEKIPETRQERRPPPPSRPVVPIATDDPDVPDDVTIEETDLDMDLDDLLPPPPLVEERLELEEEEEEEEVVELWKVERIPSVKTKVNPPYPEIARKAGIEDKVFVMVLVDKEGNVEQIGEIRGAEVFHDAVREAVPKWKFNPALQNDKPVKVWVSLPITFTLK